MGRRQVRQGVGSFGPGTSDGDVCRYNGTRLDVSGGRRPVRDLACDGLGVRVQQPH
jgi:hypothetical protein